jgi:glycosyltransferase involved in cell wall biosynthesis
MSEQPSIGVVIPSDKEGQDFINTLKSMFNQTYPFAEVVVVDDSSDGTE